MLELWFNDLEGLEAINQDEGTRDLILRLAALSRGGRLGTFVSAVKDDDELDRSTKDHVLELASDETFLLAVEDYLRRCRLYH